jgi:hypothetical protein
MQCFSFGKCSHHGDKKYHVQIVQRAFLEMLLQKLPYFEEKQSEVATFRHWVHLGGNQNKSGFWKNSTFMPDL